MSALLAGALLAPLQTPKLAGVQPVEPHEVVEAVAAALRDHAGFVAHLRPAGALYVHRLPLRSADGAEAESAPLWALLREMEPLGPRSAAPGLFGAVAVRVQLQLNLAPEATADPDGVLGHGHALAYEALEWLALDVADGSGRFATSRPVRQVGRPTPARYDDAGRLYSSAYYLATVYPAAAS